MSLGARERKAETLQFSSKNNKPRCKLDSDAYSGTVPLTTLHLSGVTAVLLLTFLFHTQRSFLSACSNPTLPWHQYTTPRTKYQSSSPAFHVYFTSASFLKMQNMKALQSNAL